MNRQQRLERLRREIEDSVLLRHSLLERLGEKILETANVISGVIGSGGKLLIAGNGVMAGAASQFVAQLMIKQSALHTRQALPAVALSADTSVLTAVAADLGVGEMFARQVEGLGHRGDMLAVMSADGEESNLLRAVQCARERNILTLGLLGGTGGKLAGAVDRALIVPHPSPQRVLEEQLFITHLLVELIESDLFA